MLPRFHSLPNITSSHVLKANEKPNFWSEISMEEESRSNNSAASAIKRRCLSISTSLKLGFRYVKATLVGQAKKVSARNEREATEADMIASKMQVDAADDAESAMKQINKSY